MPFSFREDKVGFFATLALLAICLIVVVTTIVLITVGAAQGDWQLYILPWKWVVGSCWIACIVTVLVRLMIFRHQMLQAERREAEAEAKQEQQPRT